MRAEARFEQVVDLDASLEAVWDAISDPGELAELARLERRARVATRRPRAGRRRGRHGPRSSSSPTSGPGEQIAWHWWSDTGDLSSVELHLDEHEGHTRLRIVETTLIPLAPNDGRPADRHGAVARGRVLAPLVRGHVAVLAPRRRDRVRMSTPDRRRNGARRPRRPDAAGTCSRRWLPDPVRPPQPIWPPNSPSPGRRSPSISRCSPTPASSRRYGRDARPVTTSLPGTLLRPASDWIQRTEASWSPPSRPPPAAPHRSLIPPPPPPPGAARRRGEAFGEPLGDVGHRFGAVSLEVVRRALHLHVADVVAPGGVDDRPRSADGGSRYRRSGARPAPAPSPSASCPPIWPGYDRPDHVLSQPRDVIVRASPPLVRRSHRRDRGMRTTTHRTVVRVDRQIEVRGVGERAVDRQVLGEHGTSALFTPTDGVAALVGRRQPLAAPLGPRRSTPFAFAWMRATRATCAARYPAHPLRVVASRVPAMGANRCPGGTCRAQGPWRTGRIRQPPTGRSPAA